MNDKILPCDDAGFFPSISVTPLSTDDNLTGCEQILKERDELKIALTVLVQAIEDDEFLEALRPFAALAKEIQTNRVTLGSLREIDIFKAADVVAKADASKPKQATNDRST